MLHSSLLKLILLISSTVFAIPVTQPVYQSAPAVQLQYTQQYPQELLQPQTVYRFVPQTPATPVKEQQRESAPQQFVSSLPQQVLPNSVEQQVRRAQQQTYQPGIGAYATQPALRYQQIAPAAPAQYVAPAAPTQYVAPAAPTQYVAPSIVSRVRTVRPQPPPAPVQYRAQLQPEQQQQPQQEPEDYDPNPSYAFGFDVKDDIYTNYQNRKEQREGNKITGSYSVVDADGYIRTVTYTADPKEGFKAEVNRQPTDIVVKVPTPAPIDPNSLLRQKQTQQYLEASGSVGRVPDSQKQRIVYEYRP